MRITREEFAAAEAAMEEERRRGYAIAARCEAGRLIVSLHTGVELAVPTRIVQGLSHAAPEALAEIEICPSGLGLHWPMIDADVYIPGLLGGVFGTKKWMAELMGEKGGKAGIPGKAAVRANGKKGGRPRGQQVKRRAMA